MFRDPQVILKYEAKRNPTLAYLMDNVQNLTEYDIQTAEGKLMPWMRQALLGLKKTVDFTATMARVSAQMKDHIIDGNLPDPPGEMRRWTGDNRFINLKRGNLEIKSGELFWLDGKGGVWIDSIYSPIDPVLLSCSVSCGQMSRLAYMDAVRDRARGQAMPWDPVILNTSNTSSPLVQAGVRMYRPG